MFGNLFRKRSRSLDELIFDIAEHHRDADYDELYVLGCYLGAGARAVRRWRSG